MRKEREIGAVITDAGSSKKNKTGSWRSLKPVIDRERCTGCRICEKFCPDAAVKVINKKAEVDYDYCKGCGICSTECPVKCIILEKEKK